MYITVQVALFLYDKDRKENYYVTKTTSISIAPQYRSMGCSTYVGVY